MGSIYSSIPFRDPIHKLTLIPLVFPDSPFFFLTALRFSPPFKAFWLTFPELRPRDTVTFLGWMIPVTVIAMLNLNSYLI